MSDSWKEIKNPWEDVAKKWLDEKYVEEKKYVHPDDKDTLLKYQNDFQFSIPPLPFQGTPEAKIWLLLLNPGYEKTESDAIKKNDEIREAYLNQLLFKKKKQDDYYNFVLNSSFEKYCKKGTYSYQWFRNQIMGNNCFKFDLSTVDSLFFTLQSCPYSSESNGFSHQTRLRQHWYNRELIDWGVEHNKVFVIGRAMDYWLGLINPKAITEHPERFFTTNNPRNVSISPSNLRFLDDLQKEKAEGIFEYYIS